MYTLLATCLVLLPMQLGENEVYLNILENRNSILNRKLIYLAQNGSQSWTYIYVIIGMFQTLEHAGNATIALGLIIMH